MDIFDWGQNAIDRARDFASGLTRPTVRLGVTGLSRSGKTVFITALVHNLVDGGWLPFFEPVAQGRLVAANLLPPPPEADLFAYESYLAALTGTPPSWPERTDSISEFRLRLHVRPRDGLAAFLGERTVDVEIVDYPGEWLLDLPLLAMDFAAWSEEALALARSEPRRALAAPFLRFVDGLTPGAPFSSVKAFEGSALFREYLKFCRGDAHALSTLPPGRFLEPGRDAEKPMMNFFPLPMPPDTVFGAPVRTDATLMRDQLATWYDTYKSTFVEPFFREHFSRLDRQIVLVDTLKALNAGPAAVEDLERAIASVMGAFRQGRQTVWSRIFSPRIDKVLFAATKADHLHASGFDRLEAIMERIVERAETRAKGAGAEVAALAIASVRATRQASVRKGRETFPSIVGVPMPGETIDGQTYDGVREAVIYPGDLPEDPGDAIRTRQDIRFIRFQPPALGLAEREDGAPAGDGRTVTLPHIRLDRALQFLLGDKLT